MYLTFSKGVMFIVTVLIWITVLNWFKKNKMSFFSFLIGTLGSFTILMIFLLEPLEKAMGLGLIKILEVVGSLTHLFNVYPAYSILSVKAYNGIVSMMINYECSGVIEILVYISLVAFFPFLSPLRRILAALGGILYIMAINILRIITITGIIKMCGIYSFNIAHTVIARALFFGLMVVLYYYVFTRVQLRKQGVGGIR